MLVYNCVKQALANSIDPREHLDKIDWSVWAPNVLLGPDLHKLWVYISQEVIAISYYYYHYFYYSIQVKSRYQRSWKNWSH